VGRPRAEGPLVLRPGAAAGARKAPLKPAEDKPGLAARQVAAKMLGAVIDRKTSVDGLLNPDNGNPAFRSLSAADQGLVRAIVLTTLRRLVLIEGILGRLLEKPLPEGARALHHSLVTAAAQILFMDIPDHAAVDLAVEQASRDPRSRRFANLTNAILRRMSREKDALLESAEQATDNAPQWFAERLRAVYGAQQARAILAMHALEPALDLTVKQDPQGWAEKLGGKVMPTGSVRLLSSDTAVPDLPGYGEGAWWVQDAAASLPARLFGDLAGKRVADLCAAPGGKTAQLIAQGAKVTTFDLSASRLKRLSANLARLGYEADLVEGDFQKVAEEQAYDAVLLDAPCSSTGTVRRHPDVPWTKGPEDIAKLAALQETMLRRAVALVRPGGTIVFSNCSLDPMEGEEVVARILRDMPVKRVPIDRADLPGLEELVNAEGDLRSTPAMLADAQAPHLGGLDGFYAAVLRVEG
jgi:16S rRNA (cytosine967-C5)-methyltransferase